jgi:hypothetical protein
MPVRARPDGSPHNPGLFVRARRVAAALARAAGTLAAICAATPTVAAPVTAPQPTDIRLSAAFDATALGLFCAPAHAEFWPLEARTTPTSPSLRPQRLAPRDCLVSSDNPPVWVWPPSANAAAPSPDAGYTLHLWRSDADMAQAQRFRTSRPYLHLSQPLPPGDYVWQVQWHGSGSGNAARSTPLRLRIDAQAHRIVWPEPEAVVAAAARRARPRLLPDAPLWPAVRDAAVHAQGPRHDLFAAWRRQANAISGQAMAPEPASNADASPKGRYQSQRRVVQAAGQMLQEITRLAVMSHLAREADDAEPAGWRRAARERLLRLASWPPDGATSHAQEDLANRFVTQALVIGLDLLHDDLSPEQRAHVRRQAQHRLAQQLDSFRALLQGQWPYDSHGVAGAGQAAAMALLLAGDDAEQDRRSVELLHWLLPNALAWGEQDGSDANGHFYGWLNQAYAAQAALVLQRVGELPLQARGVLRNAPLWHAAFTPTPSRALADAAGFVPGFGDGSDPAHAYVHGYHSTLSRLLADLLPAGPGRRMAQRLWQRSPDTSLRWQQDALFLLAPLTDADNEAAPRQGPVALAFADSGLAALHSSLDDPQRNSVYFRAHHLGAFNHAMADNGAFTLWVGGKPVLINAGYYDFHGSAHHRRVARRTQLKNALTLDGGRGQLEDAKGEPAQAASPGVRLLTVAQQGDVSLLSADLAAAYRPAILTNTSAAQRDFSAGELGAPLLTHYVRAILRDEARRTTVVVDAAASASPRSFELNFHALLPWQWHSGPQPVGRWQARAAGTDLSPPTVCLSLHDHRDAAWLGEQHTQFLDAGGQEVSPATPHRRQHHLIWATAHPQSDLRTVTVIQDDCTQALPTVQWAAGGDSVRIVYADGRTLVVADLPRLTP